MSKSTEKDKPVPVLTRIFHACLLILGAVLVLWLALELLAQIWGWLVLLAAIGAAIWALVFIIRWQRDRRW